MADDKKISELTSLAGSAFADDDYFVVVDTSAGATKKVAKSEVVIGLNPYLFSTIAVSGQSDVVADSRGDTLTLAAGSNVTITTNASTDTITIAASGGGTPGGSDTQVQFNDGGSFAGDSGLVWNKTSNLLTCTGAVLVGSGTMSVGTSGVGVLVLGNSTAPTSSPADEVQVYAADVDGATSGLHVRSENGHVLYWGQSYLGRLATGAGGQNFNLRAASGLSGNTDGGSVTLVPGAPDGSGAYGQVVINWTDFQMNFLRSGNDINVIFGGSGVQKIRAAAPRFTGGNGTDQTNVSIGNVAAGTSGLGVLVVGNGTAPTSSPADAVQVYAADYTAGESCLFARTEADEVYRVGHGGVARVGAGAGGQSLTLTAASGLSGNTWGGSVWLIPGLPDGSGGYGQVKMNWNDLYINFKRLGNDIEVYFDNPQNGLQVIKANGLRLMKTDATPINLSVGDVAAGSSAVGVVVFGNGTAPTTAPADVAQVWADDVSAGNAVLNVRGESTYALRLRGGLRVVQSGGTPGTHEVTLAHDGTNAVLAALSGAVDLNACKLINYYASTNAQTGTTYTLAASDAGKVVTLSNASAITLTLPNSLSAGFVCTVIQKGAGQVTFSAGSGATLRNRSSHTKTAGQYAVCTLYVDSNSGGSAADYYLAGDTGA